MTLLYVDDDGDDRDIFCEAVSGIYVDLHCVVAKDAKSALEIVKTKPVDLIFLDYRLTEMDGVQFMKELKTVAGPNQKIRVYVYSTFMQDFEIENCKKLGAVDCFKKPGSVKQIEELVKKVLKDIMANPT